MIAIGVDIGGGSLKGGAINNKGEVLASFAIPMDRFAEPEVTFSSLANAIKEFINSHSFDEPIIGVGLGVPGLINKETGEVASSPNMPKWLNFNIIQFMEERLNLPVKIVNDASAAALGEAKFGSGKKYKYLVMLTLGTGVGGGIVYEGKLIDGNLGMGAQLGHSIIVLNGRKCGCGRRGCLEAYASATALTKQTKWVIRNNPHSGLAKIAEELGKVDARTAFIAAREGDKLGNQLVDDYVMYLSEGIMDIANTLRPDVIVLSGGVANEGDYLINKLVDYVSSRNYGYNKAPSIDIKKAELGYDSGKIGAASLFF